MSKLFAIDVSGGISARTLDLVVKIIRREAGPSDQAVSFDTQVRPLGPARDIRADKLHASGGTLAQVVIDYAASNGFRCVRFFSDGLFMENSLQTHGLDLSIDLFQPPLSERWVKDTAIRRLAQCQVAVPTGRGFSMRMHYEVPVPGFPFLKKMRVNRIITL